MFYLKESHAEISVDPKESFNHFVVYANNFGCLIFKP